MKLIFQMLKHLLIVHNIKPSGNICCVLSHLGLLCIGDKWAYEEG